MSLITTLDERMIFDPAKLKGVDPTALSQFMIENSKAIGQRINEAAKEQLLKGYVPGYEPSYMPHTEAPERYSRWYKLLRSRLCVPAARGAAVQSLLPIAAYLYDCYGFSPSKFILGCEAQTTLPAWLQNWLDQTDALTSDEISKLYDILESDPPVRCDTVYIFKSRIQEMAAERGIPCGQFLLYPGNFGTDRPILQAFDLAAITQTNNPYEATSDFLGSQKILRLIISLCVNYQVSCEYLLLQDYSDFVITAQGRYYPPAQRKLLSMLLSAGVETRMKAIGYVFAASAKRLSCGGILPGYIRPGIDDLDQDPSGVEGPANVLEAASAAMGTITKTAFDNEFAESLKPKLLEVLAASSIPVSNARLYQVVEGPSRLVRKALLSLAAEGKIERVPMGREADTWRLAKDPRGRKPKAKSE